MSATAGGQRLEIEDGLQVIEVGAKVEGNADAGRVAQALTALEPREVWGFGASDPANLTSDKNKGEIEINVTRDQSSIDNPEVSAEVADGASGFSINETVWEFGWSMRDDIVGEERHAFQETYLQMFPVPVVWQEDETWFVTFFANTAGGVGSFMGLECRIYFTASERQVVPNRSRIV